MTRPIEELVKEGERLLALNNPVANANDMADLIRDLLLVAKNAERDALRYRIVRKQLPTIQGMQGAYIKIFFTVGTEDSAKLYDSRIDAILAAAPKEPTK